MTYAVLYRESWDLPWQVWQNKFYEDSALVEAIHTCLVDKYNRYSKSANVKVVSA